MLLYKIVNLFPITIIKLSLFIQQLKRQMSLYFWQL